MLTDKAHTHAPQPNPIANAVEQAQAPDNAFFYFSHARNVKNTTHASLPTLAQLPDEVKQHLYSTASTRSSIDDAGLALIQGCFTYTEPATEKRKERVKLVVESEAARVLAGILAGQFAFNGAAQAWHRFTGTHWQPCPASTEAMEFISQVMYLGCDPVGFRQTYLIGVVGILLKSNQAPLPASPTGKIPFKNGLLDMATGNLEPVTPDNAATWCIPHGHAAGDHCPAFKRWLLDAVDNDHDTTRLLLAFITACLTGRADLQKFLHLQGPGGTGKGTFMRLLTAILGKSNCVSTDLRQLETNRFESARLYGKRLACITDSDKYGGSVNVLKALTGQDAVRLERKNQQQDADFTFEGMVIIASNEALATTDHTSGLARRPVVVRFDKRLTEADKQRFDADGGEAALHAEIPHIINLALAVPREAVTQIFRNPPAKAAQATFQALADTNPVVAWIEEWVIPEPGAWTQVGVKKEARTPDGAVIFERSREWLYAGYATWCRHSGREALSLRRFSATVVDMLGTLGIHAIVARRGPGAGIQGIRLRQEHENPHDWQGGAGSSAGKCCLNAGLEPLEAAPVLDVTQMLDFSPNQPHKKSEAFDDAKMEVFEL